MTIFQAYSGGVSAFFSAWIFCLFQIVPFFLAFLLGSAVTERPSGSFSGLWKRVLVMAVVSLAGFVVTFSSMGMTTTALSKTIFKNMDLFSQLGGVVVGLAGFYLLGLLKFDERPGVFLTVSRLTAGFLFGGAMGLAYKPCVTPTLTKIFNLTNNAQTAGVGGVMLVAYALGISTVILAVGLALAWGGLSLPSSASRSVVMRICGVLLLVSAALILSDSMTLYKSFLVGRFVPDVSHAPGM